mmetsp:Transcript_22989/g.20881  ORF Transcript_22989/g.20881 Transcript_22989/m.20881 type:complete len:230 (-) Transcript_22989:113-802(-)|eukprot:CAMPEP_0196762242 /NCGR_PEP_ID=MMETSP1095-20130614/1650_1 /TAXON_ID=96789 ORGANISM="Chromulina nebulosa, Strain UTEXLB2642" /NCGR_SAMPLE_ID=MMETSP1095 /ASSEMBLY_ACC=CAM_ASM_000446 /LENGTH=229 /DNA_ID=CAMNT_0042112791 /DNA_START=48 /DNA_END=737 /DNA_ORIENTATION=+
MDDEEVHCKVEYLDLEDDNTEETNWIKRPGKCRVTYPNGDIFEGTYDNEKIKQGHGVYIWMGPTSEEDETLIEKARFEGNYVDGQKTGYGKMIYPNGDIYEGEWLENLMNGEGSYTYKKSGDIYSGTWIKGKKQDQGRYEFNKDRSMFVGTWEKGQFTNGTWELKGAGVYEGQFKLGRPIGQGQYSLVNGLIQTGSYEEIKSPDDEEPAEDEDPKPPNVAWKGDSIVSF